ncbi:citrate transporter [Thermosipho melanesiensis]|uniref:Citrate transporter n=2 Tax=Thermosipho melanesiensis TaxID=46541 RepID=A6LL57_THEM4|nr:SLC13 family permease [Thermosipho melanesiensis]ABR30658.1 Citrate transporter [Thermosipho melanesiensis BI429]APT73793.1 citrate transporter [Thermosipho melanesiensis]OOC35731.1 citrate transporter [Thermosipho melanesiensis]OOC39030.1 citrate transporter [Thermosipho melanesiensis]OOC39178.1 citrate transporter [Thermosipho melanesiensis]
MDKVFAIVVVAIAYGYIIFGKKYKAPIVFGLAILVAAFRLVEGLEPSDISKVVDFNTLGLLAGMTVIVEFLKKTGFFQFLAIRIVKIGGKRFFLTIAGLMVLVAISSAFLDNLVTIILIAPMIFLITDSLGLNPIPFLMLTIFIDNIGGMSTLIGSPLNLVLGSVSGLGFNDFLKNMWLITIISFIITLFLFKKYTIVNKDVEEKLEKLSEIDESRAITNKKSLKFTLAVFFVVLSLFGLHQVIEVDLSFVALLGAIVVMLFHKKEFNDISSEIDWDTLFFYAGLYILSYALEEVGITSLLANLFLPLSGRLFFSILAIFAFTSFSIPWLSAVPGTLIIAPVIKILVNAGFSSTFWWVYAVSANLATNLTPLGAVQNIVGVNLLSKQIGRNFSFGEYMKWAFKPFLATSLAGFVFVIAKLYFGG